MTRRNTILANLPPILLALSMAYIGVLGIISTDFGLHWDESKMISTLQNSVKEGLFLPRWYNYPSLTYDVSMLAAAPHVITQALHSWGADQWYEPDVLTRHLGEPAFHLQLRSIFFLLSMFSALPVYLLARKLSGSAWIALFAGLTSISTWELVYHARWIAPDCLLALCISWSIFAQYQVLNSEDRSRRVFWVLISAIFAGLCIGAKYPGGIVLVPLTLAITAPYKRSESITSTFLLLAGSLLVAAIVFLLTTPGSLLEPSRFSENIRTVISHYSHGHAYYTVNEGWDHFSKLLLYLASVFLSKNTALAVAAAALAVFGAAYMLKTRARTGIWFLSLPALYALYMSSQRVMIVRNYQLLLPFLAVLTGLGLFAAASAMQSRRGLRFPLYVAAVFFILFNFGVATKSSLGIFRPHTVSEGSAIESRITSSPETRFFLSPTSLDLLGADAARQLNNVVDTIDSAEKLIFLSNEGAYPSLRVANVPGRYRTVWSRLDEVNWDYYPSWAGHHRVLEVSVDDPVLRPLISKVIPSRSRPPSTAAAPTTVTSALVRDESVGDPASEADAVEELAEQDTCASPTSLCLNQRRFQVEVEWQTAAGNEGLGQVVPFGADDSGLFYFFAANNWEMLVKVLDGCEITNHYWVFAAATTDVGYTLRVTDTATGTVKEYVNPIGGAAPAITDTSAFATCP